MADREVSVPGHVCSRSSFHKYHTGNVERGLGCSDGRKSRFKEALFVSLTNCCLIRQILCQIR